MLAAEKLTRINPYKGNPYRFPGHPELPGLNGLFLAGTRAQADEPRLFNQHIESGYIDQYLDYEMRYQPPDVQQLLQDVRDIPDPRQRTEELFTLLQEISARYAYPTPRWVTKAKPMYQIMVDRFCNPDLWSQNPDIRKQAQANWKDLQNRRNRDFDDNSHFAGGTLDGILGSMDYLKSIAGGLYLNPIFESDTVHGYNTADYLSVNHRFTGFSDEEYLQANDEERAEMKYIGIRKFDQLTNEIPVVLDIAVNHTGRAHYAFRDIEEQGANSQYKNWYQDVKFDWGGKLKSWKGWWGHDSLPVLDHYNPDVRNHFLGEGYAAGQPIERQSYEWRNWVNSMKDAKTRRSIIADPVLLEEAQRQLGVIGFWSTMMSGNKPDGGKKNGGWRLDVPNDINRPEFWNEFRTLVKSIDPELWTIGEIWDNENEANWLNGDKFDGVMNYRFWQWTLDYLIGDTPTRRQHLSGDRACSANAYQFADRVNWFVSRHPKQVIETMMNNAGTHDVIRIDDLLGNKNKDQDKTDLGLTIMMTLPGSPSIWAGDEIGMNNQGCPIVTDPMNRKPIAWELAGKHNRRLSHVQKLAALREKYSSVTSSNISFVDTGNPDILVYIRTSDEESKKKDKVVVMVNRSGKPAEVPHESFTDLDVQLTEYASTKQGIQYKQASTILPANCGVVYVSK